MLERKPLKQSPAGVKASDALAWYQTLSTYEGEQDTFHRRHLVTPLAKEVMAMKCNTCHQGDDPREEAQIPPDHSNRDFTLRKSVNPEICLMCHGASPYKLMGLPTP
ncbi:cytochrome c3 family protein [Solemya velesiana gill symbiont]|uniref:cytochrome c3 family protein n=1 Tax=Solemya velesiana gill symbiont TaxID=1918948 RepID=UPI001FE94D19|nr:cytochrome c3 family protein [Solemya velesiana gill symbiont]